MRPDESFIGQSVRSLQTMLRIIGEDAGRDLTVIPDGIYGQQTRAEVSRFQQERGMPVTGVVNQETWERIAGEYDDAFTRVGPAEPIQIIMNPGMQFQLGQESYYIFLIQAMLHALAEIYGSLSAPPITGQFDAITEDAVSIFQRLSGLPETGIVDKITWKHLALQYPLAINRKETANRIQR